MKLDLIGEDLEKYSEFFTEYHDCIICGKKTRIKEWAKYGSYTAVQCNICKLIWVNPGINSRGLEEYYNDYIGMRLKDIDKTKKRRIQYKIDKEFIELFINKGKVLDIGCGDGLFLSILGSSFDKYGIEVDHEAVVYVKKHYAFGRNVNAILLKDIRYPKEFFDLIIMRGVVEHLSRPDLGLEKAVSMLKRNGYFYFAATPNADSFSANLYREHWNLFHPVRHVYYFSPKTLSTLCSKYNLRLVAKDFPYLETPYANIIDDHLRVLNDYKKIKNGKADCVKRSPAFWGNIMNLVFKKY